MREQLAGWEGFFEPPDALEMALFTRRWSTERRERAVGCRPAGISSEHGDVQFRPRDT